jgi:hypothetical protein
MRNYFVLLIVLQLFIVNLNAQSVYRKNVIQYTGIEEQKTYHLYNKKNNPNCHIKINFFYPDIYTNEVILDDVQTLFITNFFGDEYLDVLPKDAVKIYSNHFIEGYIDLFEKTGIYKKEIETAKLKGEDAADFDILYSSEKTIRNTILFNRGNIISQVINTYEYSGGAHGSSFTKGLVIDLNTGYQVTYDNVFDKNTTEKISELLFSALIRSRELSDRESLLDAGFDFDELLPTSNFVADDKGITFIYNPYELGAYVLGIVEIFVSYEDIFPYMKRSSPLIRLIKIY